MDAFIGSWKLFDTENFAEYLRALGMSEDLVTVAQVNKPTITFYEDGDYIVLKTETCTHTGEIWFRFGEEYFEKTRDGRNCQNLVTLDGSKLVQVQKWDGKETTFVREVKDDQLVMTLTYGSTKAKLTYKKV